MYFHLFFYCAIFWIFSNLSLFKSVSFLAWRWIDSKYCRIKNILILSTKKKENGILKLTLSVMSCFVCNIPSNLSFSSRFFIRPRFSSIILRRSVAIFSSTFLSISARFSLTASSFDLASNVRNVPSKLAKSRVARFFPWAPPICALLMSSLLIDDLRRDESKTTADFFWLKVFSQKFL